ncbi:MAG: hypothetical protein JWO48_3740 [Bryobacterales bacterium]|nr:hypothetical protein [Bryobacterales bacterium]
MFGANPAGTDIRTKITLAFDWGTGHTPKHRDLSHVCQRIRDRALKQLFRWKPQGIIGGQIGIERAESGKEALYFPIPGERLRIMPLLFSLGEA